MTEELKRMPFIGAVICDMSIVVRAESRMFIRKPDSGTYE